MRNTHGWRAPMRANRGRDRGQTFVEILVSIVLLGTAVGGTLTALRTTIVSTEVDDGKAKADAWLREAEVALHLAPYAACTLSGAGAVASAYRTVVQAVPPPDGWTGATIDVTSVRFWGRDTTLGPTRRHEGWMTSCVPDPFGLALPQRIEIHVPTPTGDVRIQVVKRG